MTEKTLMPDAAQPAAEAPASEAAPAAPTSETRTRAALNKLVSAFHAYYDVNLENPIPPFVAEALFSLHDEQYVFIKKAKVSEADIKEFVYFADGEELLLKERYEELDKIAWEDGLSKAEPKANHRSSDVTLVIVAGAVAPDCAEAIRKAKHHVSYKFTFHGWSTYRVVVYDLSKGTILYNRRGEELKKVFDKINIFS